MSLDELSDEAYERAVSGEGPRATFRELLPYLNVRPALMVSAIALSLIGAVTSLVQPLFVQEIIGRVETQSPLAWLPWALLIFVIVDAVVMGFQHFLLQVIGEQVVRLSRRNLVERIVHLPISQFDARRTGDLVSRVGSDTTLLRAVLTQGLVESIGGALTLIGAVIAMALTDGWLLLISLAALAVATALAGLSFPFLRKASQKAQEEVGHLTSALERSISGVRTVRAARAEDAEIATIGERTEGAYRAGIRVAKISAVIVPLTGVAMQVAFLGVVGVGGLRVAAGDMSIGSLVAFLMFMFLMVGPLAQIIGAVQAVSIAMGALGRIQEVARIPSEAERADALVSTLPAPTEQPHPDAAVEFRDVFFHYEPTDGEEPTPVLEGVSFLVPRGRKTALVGPSGAGKSTSFALIERFYDPVSGTIFVNGHDTQRIAPTELRKGIGYVEQNARLLAGTIRENLLLGNPDATDEQLLAVLETANLSDIVERTPKGLDAQVGEGGVRLSGGQAQRLAIARALLTAPPLLLLDESTSNLDSLNEAQLNAAINQAAAGRTLLVIAHRLSTVVDSDHIVVFNRGRVEAEGTHEELVERSDLYRSIASQQLLT